MAEAASATKTGVDDFLAAGGTVAELLLMARPYEPSDAARERLGRDEKLRHAVEERRRYLRQMPAKTTGENTRVAVVRVLTLEAEKRGELVEGGVRVVMDRRTLAERAAKSKKAVDRAIKALEDEPGALRVDNAGRRADRAGAFVLPIAQKVPHYGEKGRPEEEGAQQEGRGNPHSNATSDRGGYPSALGGADEVPALRWSKTIFYWEWQGSTRKLADYFYVARLGEKRGQIIRHILEDGGSSSIEDLMGRFAGERTRPWDFRRRTLGPLVKAGILEETAAGASLTDNWREALELERERAGELDDARRQRDRHAEQRRKYRQRDRTAADEELPLKGKEHVSETLERNRGRWEAHRLEDERRKAGTTAATFLADELEGVAGVRWRELRERWTERGGKGEHLRQAVASGPYRFGREAADGDNLYVYPVGSSKQRPGPRPEPAPVVPIRSGEAAEKLKDTETPKAMKQSPEKKKPPSVNGVYVHGSGCECWLCDDDNLASVKGQKDVQLQAHEISRYKETRGSSGAAKVSTPGI